MEFAIILVCAVAACFLLRNPIKKRPMLFYVLAVVIDVVFIAGSFIAIPHEIWRMFFILIQKCTLALALFVVVMFIGVLPRNSKACIWLKPIRAELSIIAWILSLGHMAVYLGSYIPKIFGGASVNNNVLGAFVLALILFILLILLGVTSFNFIKKQMKGTTWKKVQKLSYPFFILVYLHVLFMLLPSALHGGIAAGISVAVYSVIFIGYIVLRLVRRALDKQEGEADDNSSVALC